MRAGILFLGLLLTLTVLLSIPGGADDAPPEAAVVAGPVADPGASAPAEAASSSTVAVFDFGYTDSNTGTEATLISTGQSVFWIWTEGTHSVTAGTGTPADSLTGRAFDSGLISTSSNDPFFVHTFGEPGVYEYYCTVHLGMRGVVVVA